MMSQEHELSYLSSACNSTQVLVKLKGLVQTSSLTCGGRELCNHEALNAHQEQ